MLVTCVKNKLIYTNIAKVGTFCDLKPKSAPFEVTISGHKMIGSHIERAYFGPSLSSDWTALDGLDSEPERILGPGFHWLRAQCGIADNSPPGYVEHFCRFWAQRALQRKLGTTATDDSSGHKSEKSGSKKIVMEHVAEFLNRIGLGQYTAAFVHNGYDSLDLLFVMDDTDFEIFGPYIGVLPGHLYQLKKT